MSQVNIFLDSEIEQKILKLKAKWGLPKSEVLIKIIKMFFEEGGDEIETPNTI
jgi:hypothetical protein